MRFKSLVQCSPGCTVIANDWILAMHPAQGRSYKTITLNRKQMALGDLATGKQQLCLVLWPIFFSFFGIFFYPDACKPFHHDLQWRKCRRGWGVWAWGGEWWGGRGHPEGLFSQLMTRNTLLFLAGQTFAVHKCGRLRLTTKALTESRRLSRC